MVIRIVLIFSLFVMLISPVHADELTIYCEYPSPKKTQVDSKGSLIYAQVWELMRRAGIKKPIQTVSWKRGYTEATTHSDIGLFPTTRTPEREELFHWVGPIIQVVWSFYAHADSNLAINSLDDARAVKAIGIYAHDSKGQWLKAQGFTNLETVMENMTNLRKLYDGRIDLMTGSANVTDQWPVRLGVDPEKLVKAYTFKTVDLYLALSLGTDPETVKALQSAMAEMSKDGTLKSFYDEFAPELDVPLITAP